AVGVKPEGTEMLEIIAEIPKSILNMNPDVAIIAIISFAILIGIPMVKNKYISHLPAPLLVILVAIPLGHFFDLETVHKYLFLNGHEYTLGPKFLVNIPENFMDGIVFPRFDYLFTGFGIQMMITYSLVASLESLLTAAAIDKLDPYRRITNYNKELFAKGGGNILSSAIGGLPIIAEVVRSSANVNNGAKTRWANFYHGIFLLIFVVFLGKIIHQIPLAALAAMLMVTGYRLAAPKEFAKTHKVGKEQLAIFVSTVIFTLATDLLIGILVGIVVKLVIHLINGVPLKSLFKPFFTMEIIDEEHYVIDVEHSAIFSNFMSLKKHLEELPSGKKITIDFTNTKLVDHSVRSHLHELAEAYHRKGGEFYIIGLDNHTSLSDHPRATVKR
ncbi:MAG: SulP family inorganic anion transporter, partial [Bacteroidia bacterium]|nr:SulP family inorganic anion transporter [Bacteroidia bacterium]